MRKLLVFAPLILFGSAGIYLFTYFMRVGSEDAFQSSLLPELIGFCLEGFFLVGLPLWRFIRHRRRVIEYRQRRRDAAKRVAHKDVASRPLKPERRLPQQPPPRTVSKTQRTTD